MQFYQIYALDRLDQIYRSKSIKASKSKNIPKKKEGNQLIDVIRRFLLFALKSNDVKI